MSSLYAIILGQPHVPELLTYSKTLFPFVPYALHGIFKANNKNSVASMRLFEEVGMKYRPG
jgi:hypothetical protein